MERILAIAREWSCCMWFLWFCLWKNLAACGSADFSYERSSLEPKLLFYGRDCSEQQFQDILSLLCIDTFLNSSQGLSKVFWDTIQATSHFLRETETKILQAILTNRPLATSSLARPFRSLKSHSWLLSLSYSILKFMSRLVTSLQYSNRHWLNLPLSWHWK